MEENRRGTIVIRPVLKPSEDIRKVCVTKDTLPPQFIQLDQNRPLAQVIEDLCTVWKLENPTDYSLQFDDTKTKNTILITEKNRMKINQGDVLKLTQSASKTALEIISGLQSNKEGERARVLQSLQSLSADETFAERFLGNKGLALITGPLENGSFTIEETGLALKAFVELMEHGGAWDSLDQRLIRKVASYVNRPKTEPVDPGILVSAMQILESVVSESTRTSVVEQEVTPENLLHHFETRNPEVHTATMALINTLFSRADRAKRKVIAGNLQTKSMRDVLSANLFNGAPIGTALTYQLHVLQTLMFNLLEDKLTIVVNPQDARFKEDIQELRRIAFESDADDASSPPRRHTSVKDSAAKDVSRLGFKNTANPLEDIRQVPAGVLALENMVYFARHHAEDYIKVVVENCSRADEHDCPFAQASIEVTRLLTEILKIGEAPADKASNESHLFNPMFFKHDRPFEEFYCACIQLFSKTWKEMKASHEDFSKVSEVVAEQIKRAMEKQPQTFDAFKKELGALPYSEILNMRRKETEEKEENIKQARPIKELREKIKSEILELIKQHRLHRLMEGSTFTGAKRTRRNEDKFLYLRLSPNQKTLHYGSCSEGTQPQIETLSNTINIIDITDVKEIPRQNPRKATLSFAIHTEPGVEPVTFTAKNEEDFDVWLDGLNALMGKPMTSKKAEEDMDMLLALEIKLRLLDTEGIDIPDSPPPIPPLPDNFNFVTP